MKRIERKTEHEMIKLELDDHEPEQIRATIITDTEMHAAGNEWIEGLKTLTVVLDILLPPDDVGLGGRVTRRNGDTWAVFLKDMKTLVRSGD